MNSEKVQSTQISGLLGIITICLITCTTSCSQLESPKGDTKTASLKTEIDPNEKKVPPLLISENQALSEFKDKDQIVRKLFNLKYISPQQAAQIIQPLLNDRSDLDDEGGTLSVTDKICTLLEIEKIINGLDKESTSDARLQIFEFKNWDPNEMTELLQAVVENKLSVTSSTQTESNQIIMVPVPEKNWIIIRAPDEAMELITKWVKMFDSGYPPDKVYNPSLSEINDQNQVVEKFFYLEHNSPQKVAEIIKPLLSDNGFISIEENAGTILVIDKVSILLDVKKTIKKVDIPDIQDDDPMLNVNLSQLDINDIVQKIKEWTGKEVVPDTSAMNLHITVFSPNSMRRSDALKLLYTVIRENGFVIEENNNIIYIKPAPYIPEGPQLIGTDEPLENIQDKNTIVRKVFKLNNYSASAMGQLIYPFLDSYGYLTADENSQTLMVMDNVGTLMRIEKIIRQFDVSDEHYVGSTLSLKHLSPDKAVEILNKIIELGIIQEAKETAFLPEQKNYCLLGSCSSENIELLKSLIAIIDEPENTGTANEITVTSIFKGLSDTDSEQLGKLMQVVFDNKTDVKVHTENSEKYLSVTSSLTDNFKTGKLIEWYLQAIMKNERITYKPEVDSENSISAPRIFTDESSVGWGSTPPLVPIKFGGVVLRTPYGEPHPTILSQGSDARPSVSTNKEAEKKDYEIIQTSYLAVPKAAVKLNEIIEKTDPNYVKRIYVQPLASARQLMLFGDEQARQFAKNLLEQIDLPPEYMQHDTVLLRYINAEKALEVFDNIFTGANIEYRRTILIGEPNDQLFVYGNEKFRKFISEVMKEIDNNSFAKAQKYEIITIKDANTEDVASALRTIMRDLRLNLVSDIYVTPILETKQLLVFGDKDYCDIISKLTKEYPILENQLQRSTFKFRYADPNEVQPLIEKLYGKYNQNLTLAGDRISEDTVITTVFPSLKQMLVLASVENMKQITELINLCDQENPEEIREILIDVQILEVTDEFLERVMLDANSLETSDKWSKYRLNDSNAYIIDGLIENTLNMAANESDRVIHEKIFTDYGDQINLKYPVKESRFLPAQVLRDDFKNFSTVINITSSQSGNETGIQLNCEVDVSRIKDFTAALENQADNSSKIIPHIENTNYKSNLEIILSSGDTLFIKGPEFISFDEVSNPSRTGQLNGKPEIRGTYIGYPDRTFTIKKRTELILIKPISILSK